MTSNADKTLSHVRKQNAISFSFLFTNPIRLKDDESRTKSIIALQISNNKLFFIVYGNNHRNMANEID